MKIVIPMAGTGNRFILKGYIDPKPLINVCGKLIIEYIVDMFDKDDEFVFICNETHLATTDMKKILEKIAPNCVIISIPNHKKGPIFTMMEAKIDEYIKDDEEVIVSYCDNPYLWDYSEFKKWVKNNNSDGCILSHVDFHPHRLSSTYMAYIKQNNLIVSEIKEKEPYTDNHMTEHASTGTYYFKKGKYIKKYFQDVIDLNINYNGEHYVTLVYNLLISDGLLVHSYLTDYVTVFGTPEEVENFEAWQTLLNSTQIKNEKDLIDSYKYWNSYNYKNKTINEIHGKNNERLKALVDIDETICFYDDDRIYELAIPNEENINKINKLYDEGWHITYWTARGSSQIDNKKRLEYLHELTINQLNKWGAKFHDLELGDKKQLFDLVIDDKAKRIEEL